MTDLENKFLHICEKFKKYVVPYKTNFNKIRIGGDGDGGYVICDGLPDYDFLYSYGCDDNIIFEKSFYEKYKKESYVYDHTIDKISEKPDFIHFFKEGVSYKKEQNMDTIDNHLIRNGHTHCKNLFAQIDIEGCEWNILNENFKYIDNFSQIVLEFHIPLNPHHIIQMETYFDNVFTLLNKKFVCVHVHANNSPIQPWVDSNFPRTFEVTYVRKDLAEFSEMETESYPIIGLDSPNDSNRVDLKLDYWLNSHGLNTIKYEINLGIYEAKKFSQFGEDGITIQLVKLIYGSDIYNKNYVEFGVESGTECNTRVLSEMLGWKGLLMDAGYENDKINLKKEFINKENIIKLFEKYNVPKHINLLSVDIDFNDFYCLNEILKKYTCDIIICEYNSTHLPHEDNIVIYDKDATWDETNYFGASLLSLYKLGKKYNYSLVYSTYTGVNCFFYSG